MNSLSPLWARYRSQLPAALAAAALTAALPAAAQADGLALVDETEQIAPGVELRHLKTLAADGWFDHQILTAQLVARMQATRKLTRGTYVLRVDGGTRDGERITTTLPARIR